MAQKEIKIPVGFNISQAELNSVKKAILDLKKLSYRDLMNANPAMTQKQTLTDLTKIIKVANQVDSALEKAYNQRLNTLNIKTFNAELSKSKLNAQLVYETFAKAGVQGQNAFRSLSNQLTTFNVNAKQSHKLLDKMAETLGNSIKWNIASSAVNRLSGSVQEAYGYVKSLDGSLNDIRIVTGKSADEMARFAETANKAAQNLGTTTTEYTKSALTFYQQGLNDKEANARAALSNKVANVTGLSGDQSAEYVTAVLNGYKVNAAGAEEAMDKLAAVGAATAADLGGLAEAMSKVASSANAMGVTEDQLASTLATVQSVTRQSAATVGTAFKTIYARMADIESGAEGAETTLGHYTEEMARMGFSVLDSEGHLRDLGTVMEEIGGQWANMTREQQVSLAQTMAGTRQYNNLIALFDNWSSYVDTLNVSLEANGTLQEQQQIYMEGTAAHLNKMKASLENVYDSILDPAAINGIANIISGVANITANWIDSMRGGLGLIGQLGAVGLIAFHDKIGESLRITVENFKNSVTQAQNLKETLQALQTLQSTGAGDGQDSFILKTKEYLAHFSDMMTKEDRDKINFLNNTYTSSKNDLEAAKAKREYLTAVMNQLNPKTKNVYGNSEQSGLLKEFQKTANKKITDLKNNLINFNDIDSTDITKSAEAFKSKVQKAKEDVFNYLEREGPNGDSVILGKKLASLENFDEKGLSFDKLQAKIVYFNRVIEGEASRFKDFSADMNNEIAENSESTGYIIEENTNKIKMATEGEAEELSKFASQEMFSSITQITGAVTAMGSAISTLSNLPKIWNNDDLTTGEKVIQTILAASTGISMLVTTFVNLNNGIKGILTAKAAAIAAAEAHSKVIEHETEAIKAQNHAIAENNSKLKEKTGTEVAATGVEAAGNLAEAGGDAAAEVADDIANAGGEAVEEAATGVGKKIFGKLKTGAAKAGTAIAGVFSKIAAGGLGAIIGSAAIAAAAIAGIATVAYLVYKHYNAARDAAKAANEQAERLQETYDSLKDSAASFRQEVEQYDKAVKGIDDLTKGTEEYNKAVEKANEETRALMEKYQIFDASFDENGVLRIAENKLNDIQKAKDAAVARAGQATYAAKVYANEKDLDYQTVLTQRKVENGFSEGAQQYIPPDLVEQLLPALQEFAELEAPVEFSKFIDNELNGSLKMFKDAILANEDALVKLGRTAKNQAKENQYFYQNLVSEGIKENYQNDLNTLATGENGVVDTALVNETALAIGNLINTKSGEKISQAVSKAGEVAEDTTSNRKLNILLEKHEQKTFEKDEGLAETYARIVLGKTEDEIAAMSYEGDWGHGKLVDGNGNTVLDKDDKDMRREIAQILERDSIEDVYGESAATLLGIFKKMESSKGKDQLGADFGGLIRQTLASGKTVEEMDFSKVYGNLDPEEVRNLLGMSGTDIASALGLTNDDLTKLGFENADAFGKSFSVGLANYDSSIWGKKVAEIAEAGGEAARTLMEGLQKGTIDGNNITGNEAFKALMKSLDAVEDKTAQLQGVQELLNKTWLVGTQEYMEALGYAQDALYELQIRGLSEAANEAREEASKASNVYGLAAKNSQNAGESLKSNQQISLTVNEQKFQDSINEILDAEYQIDVAVHTHMEGEFDSAVTALDEMEKASAKIGENFIISASDVRELNNVFPGIHNSMEVLADGSVKLNEKVAKAAMEAAKAEAEQDIQTAKNKIQTQAAILRAKQKSYENLALLAAKMASGEVKGENEKAKLISQMDKELSNLKSEDDKLQIENAKVVADNTKSNAQIASDNWREAYALIADASADAAEVQCNNGTAAANNEPEKIQRISGENGKGFTSVAFKGATGDNSQASTVQRTEDLYEGDLQDEEVRKKWEAIAESYRQMAESAGASANDMEGMLKQLDAEFANSSHIFDNIGSGKGANGAGGKSDMMDFLEEQVDRYHDINIELKKMDDLLSRLSKDSKALYGSDLLNNLNKQLVILKAQVKTQREKVKLTEEEGLLLRAKLAGQGVSFDSEGYISNYAAVMKGKLQEVNSAIAHYNTLSEEEQKVQKDVVEKMKKNYEQFKKQVENYDKLMTETLPQLRQKIRDMLYQEIDMQVQKFDLKIKMKLDIADAEREWNSFKKEILEGLDMDEPLTKALVGKDDLLTYYNANNTGTGTVQTQTEQVNTILKELKKIDEGGHSEIYSAQDEVTGEWVDNRKKAIEDLQKFYKDLMGSLKDVKALEESVKEAFLAQIQTVQDAYNQQKELYEFLDAQIKHDLTMMELLYGDEAYSRMEQYHNEQLKNTKDELQAQENAMKYWAEKVAMEREAVESGYGSKEALAEYEKNWQASVNNVNSLIERWADNATKKYENTVSSIIQNMNNKITDGKGLDFNKLEFDLMKKNAKNYLDPINSSYAIEKMKKKWEGAIENTDSEEAQSRLNDLMNKQLDMLREKGKLSDYDIERAEKEYQIALKQNALMEAQQNKSSMRLARDANGNYNYEFVSDEDDVRDKTASLEEAKEDLYNFDKQKYEQNLSEFYDIWDEFQQKAAEVSIKYKDDEAKRTEMLNLLKTQYEEQFTYLTEQNSTIRQNLSQSAFDNLAYLYENNLLNLQGMGEKEVELIETVFKGSYDENAENFRNMTEEQKSAFMGILVESWNSGVQNMAIKLGTKTEEMQNTFGGFISSCVNLYQQLDQAAQIYRSEMDANAAKNKEVGSQIRNEADKLISKSTEVIDAEKRELEQVHAVMNGVRQLAAEYHNAANAAKQAAQAAYEYMQRVRQLHEEQARAPGSSGGSGDYISGSADWNPPSVDRNPAKDTPPREEKSQFQIINPFVPAQYETKSFSSRAKALDYWRRIYGASASGRYDPNNYVIGLKTGGYTGAWGSSGKMAMLHEKELVLNAKDTENMLNAVSVMRSIIGNIGQSALDRAAALSGSISNQSISNSHVSSGDTLEQQVYITAQFEGQTSADQIQTALNNLVNIASQRAYRKDK